MVLEGKTAVRPGKKVKRKKSPSMRRAISLIALLIPPWKSVQEGQGSLVEVVAVAEDVVAVTGTVRAEVGIEEGGADEVEEIGTIITEEEEEEVGMAMKMTEAGELANLDLIERTLRIEEATLTEVIEEEEVDINTGRVWSIQENTQTI